MFWAFFANGGTSWETWNFIREHITILILRKSLKGEMFLPLNHGKKFFNLISWFILLSGPKGMIHGNSSKLFFFLFHTYRQTLTRLSSHNILCEILGNDYLHPLSLRLNIWVRLSKWLLGGQGIEYTPFLLVFHLLITFQHICAKLQLLQVCPETNLLVLNNLERTTSIQYIYITSHFCHRTPRSLYNFL